VPDPHLRGNRHVVEEVLVCRKYRVVGTVHDAVNEHGRYQRPENRIGFVVGMLENVVVNQGDWLCLGVPEVKTYEM